ncbi:MAG: PAS domain S-box protein [Holophagales bacterium]|nr:PAS domain S-box protein [Holophagales bacterium]
MPRATRPSWPLAGVAWAAGSLLLLPVAAVAAAMGAGGGVFPLAMATAGAFCWRARSSAVGDRRRGFWARMATGCSLWAVAAAFDAMVVSGWVFDPVVPGRLGRPPILLLGIDLLHLLGYLPVALALALRPLRYGRAPLLGSGWVRQLQGAGLLWLVIGALAYFWLVPGSLEGARAPAWLAAGCDAVLALFFALGAARSRSGGGMATGSLLASAFAALGAARAWIGLPWPVAPVPVAAAFWVLAPALLIAAARVYERVGEVPVAAGAEPAAELGAAAGEHPTGVPVVLSAAILPAVHLALAGTSDTWSTEAHRLLVLSWIVVASALALVEHTLLRKRSALLEIEQRRASEETKESTVYLHSLIEHSPLAIVVLDPDHRVRLCNPAFERLFLHRSEDVEGSTLDQLIADEVLRHEADSYTRAVQAGQSVHATTRRLRADGTQLDVELYGVPLIRDGRTIGIFAIYQDVSDRVRAEQALRDSEERFRRLADAAFEGIVVSDSGVIHDCNEQYARLVGTSPAEVIGRPVRDFVDPSHWEMVEAHIEQNYRRPYEHRAVRADGKVRVVEARGRSVPHAGREMRVTAVRDVTEQKRLEEEVRQSQKMEAVGRLAGGIAHDFNNLLTVIRGYGQLLALQVGESKPRGLVDEILLASERASLMTQRLLAFGRKQAVEARVLDLDEVVAGMEKMLRRLIRADIRFDIRLRSENGHVRADPSQLEQVILNLAINAGDAMPDGGTLSVETLTLDMGVGQGHTGGPVIASGSYVRLRVRDTGTGMDDSTRDQVFEPFFTTKARGKGTGLGLATVYHIVKQSGGAIEVSSEVGQGTTFDVYLPRVPEPALDEGAGTGPEALPCGRETVLVVEDEPGVRALAVEFLELHGYRVLEAGDGEEGLRCLEELGREVDLVLTDVVMPGMNGPEMVRRLLEQRGAARVLYMSGYTDEVLGSTEPALGGRLVHKPFSVEELMLKVRETLDEATSSRSDA